MLLAIPVFLEFQILLLTLFSLLFVQILFENKHQRSLTKQKFIKQLIKMEGMSDAPPSKSASVNLVNNVFDTTL